MALVPNSQSLREKMGIEKQAKLTGDPAPHQHGTLTSQLDEILEQADPNRETYGDLERALIEAFGDQITVKVDDAAREKVVLLDDTVTKASGLLAHLNEQRARSIIASLEEVIAQREQQGYYWPEGRLNLGIAYACLGEYENARRWLEDAVNMFKYPSYIQRSEQAA